MYQWGRICSGITRYFSAKKRFLKPSNHVTAYCVSEIGVQAIINSEE